MACVTVASSHRYPDLARLWYRAVVRDVLPSLTSAGLDVEVVIFRDANVEQFCPTDFPGAVFDAPRPQARDFIEFYEAMLSRAQDYLFLIDADVFFLDSAWPASYLDRFRDPAVAAVSFLWRPELPGGVYALLCRVKDYRALPGPVFLARYEGIENWPNVIHRDPGEWAARELQGRGKTIINAQEPEIYLADFQATTNVRVSRELFGGVIGEDAFETLVAGRDYFTMGMHDNILLGALYRAVFGEAYAPGPTGEALGGSMTVEALQQLLRRIDDPDRQQGLHAYFSRSRQALHCLASREGVTVALPDLIPKTWQTDMPN